MSTINSNAIGSAGATKTTGAASLSSMSATDFLKIMTKQLANQDPQNPTSSTDLMQQLSTVYSLQSNQEMLQHQNMSSAMALMGNTISGTDANGKAVQGVVSNILVDSNGGVNLVVGQSEVPLSHVSAVGKTSSTRSDMASAALLIGSTISGTDASGKAVQGVVSQVAVDSSGGVNLVVPQTSGTTTTNVNVPLGNVTNVSYPSLGGGTGTGTSP
jgi:flagellar basal-body rod modification protein FlgD